MWFILTPHRNPVSHLIRVNNRFRNTSLGQQLAIVTGGLCLLVSLALVALGAISTRHMQMLSQDEYGTALAKLVARQIGRAHV